MGWILTSQSGQYHVDTGPGLLQFWFFFFFGKKLSLFHWKRWSPLSFYAPSREFPSREFLLKPCYKTRLFCNNFMHYQLLYQLLCYSFNLGYNGLWVETMELCFIKRSWANRWLNLASSLLKWNRWIWVFGCSTFFSLSIYTSIKVGSLNNHIFSVEKMMKIFSVYTWHCCEVNVVIMHSKSTWNFQSKHLLSFLTCMLILFQKQMRDVALPISLMGMVNLTSLVLKISWRQWSWVNVDSIMLLLPSWAHKVVVWMTCSLDLLILLSVFCLESIIRNVLRLFCALPRC